VVRLIASVFWRTVVETPQPAAITASISVSEVRSMVRMAADYRDRLQHCQASATLHNDGRRHDERRGFVGIAGHCQEIERARIPKRRVVLKEAPNWPALTNGADARDRRDRRRWLRASRQSPRTDRGDCSHPRTGRRRAGRALRPPAVRENAGWEAPASHSPLR